jgi:hypothetical protein
MADTVLDEGEKSVRAQNWLEILRGEPELFQTLMNHDDTADEVTQSEAAMRVILEVLDA